MRRARKDLEKRLGDYSAAAGAAVAVGAVLGTSLNADATPVVNVGFGGPITLNVGDDPVLNSALSSTGIDIDADGNDDVYLVLKGDAIYTFATAIAASTTVGTAGGEYLQGIIAVDPSATTQAQRFSVSQFIDGDDFGTKSKGFIGFRSALPTGSPTTTNSGGNWFSSGPNAHTGFLGVLFHDFSGSSYYGFVSLTLAGDLRSLTIDGWGYNDEPGEPIHAQQVPEPATLATLAAGAAGVFAWRRRR